jgi:hypothetical protein
MYFNDPINKDSSHPLIDVGLRAHVAAKRQAGALDRQQCINLIMIQSINNAARKPLLLLSFIINK